MHPRRTAPLCAALGLALASCAGTTLCAQAGDVVRWIEKPERSVAVVYDGRTPAGIDLDDKTRRSSRPMIPVGSLHASPVSNVVCAFGDAPPAIIADAGWTEHADVVEVAERPRIRVDFRVWILLPDFEEHAARACAALEATQQVWGNERAGLEVGTAEIRHWTEAVPTGLDPTLFLEAVRELSDFRKDERLQLLRALPPAPGRITLYFVKSVEGATTAGDTCTAESSIAVLGRESSPDLLAHELGHTFYVWHPSATDDVGYQNVMHESRPPWARKYFTEGQIFRMHLAGQSAINRELKARPGEPVCDYADITDFFCAVKARRLPVDCRVWPDAWDWGDQP